MANASTFGPRLSETSQRSPSSFWFLTWQWVSGPMGTAGKNTATAILEPLSKPRAPTELFLTGYRSLPESSTIVRAIPEKRNQLIILKPSHSPECLHLGV